MRQSVSEKYSIAWFKIAEYVARGERERALGVYRLLSHSLEDKAFAKQLEGDILRGCSDRNAAREKYHEAAALYVYYGKVEHAIDVYEYIIELLPLDIHAFHKVIPLYHAQGMVEKGVHIQSKLLHLLVQTKEWSAALELLDTYPITAPDVHARMIMIWLRAIMRISGVSNYRNLIIARLAQLKTVCAPQVYAHYMEELSEINSLINEYLAS